MWSGTTGPFSLFSQLSTLMEAGNTVEQEGSVQWQVQSTYKGDTARPSRKKTAYSPLKLMNVWGEKIKLWVTFISTA